MAAPTLDDVMNVYRHRIPNTPMGADASVEALEQAAAIAEAHRRREKAMRELGYTDELARYQNEMLERYGLEPANA